MRNFMTRKSRDSLIRRLEEIRQQRFKLTEELETAAGFGDLRENSEFDAAMEQQGWLNREAKNIHKRLMNVTLIDDLNISGEKVSIGTVVTLKNSQKMQTFIVLGCPEDESPVQGTKVTFNSPIARQLMGKQVGDIVSLCTNGDTTEMEIIKIEKAFSR